MQLMNVFYGGKLQSVPGHVATVHLLNLLRNQPFSHLEFESQVNSFHDYGMLKSDISINFQILAMVDEVVEAMIHKNYMQMGIMWHPERNNPFLLKDVTLFQDFFLRKFKKNDSIRNTTIS